MHALADTNLSGIGSRLGHKPLLHKLTVVQTVLFQLVVLATAAPASACKH
jgi:hypothetical protein